MDDSTIVALVGLVVGLLGGILAGVWRVSSRLGVVLDMVTRHERQIAEHDATLQAIRTSCAATHGEDPV